MILKRETYNFTAILFYELILISSILPITQFYVKDIILSRFLLLILIQ